LTPHPWGPIVRFVKRLLNGLPRRFRLAVGGCLGVGFLAYAYCAPFCFPAYSNGALAEQFTQTTDGFSFRDRLSKATVQFGDTPCDRWTGNRWDCERDAWLWVGQHQGRVTTPQGPEWRRCIWAHAHASSKHDETLRISWSSLEWKGPLHGEVSILDTPVSGGPANFRVLVDGRQRASVRVTNERARRDHERRWKPWSVPAIPRESGEMDVVFEISASDGAWRQVCFTAHAGELPL